MDLPVFLSVVACLLVVVGLLQPIAARMRVPLTVVLAIVGMGIGGAATFLLQTNLTNVFDDAARAVLEFPIGSQVFLYLFLPTLLFQTALTLDARRMLEDGVPILVLAVLAVVIATLVIGFSLAPFTSQPLVVCLIVGAIVATTDPSAVVGIFRDIGAPARLGRLIEGESLLNDAAAITLFGVFLTIFVTAQPIGLSSAVRDFGITLIGGALAGWIGARFAIGLLGVVREYRMAQMSISLALPYLVFIVAEQGLAVSGVIAVVSAGLSLNLLGPTRATPDHWKHLKEVWNQLAFWASTLVFVLAAILVPRMLQDLGSVDVLLIMVVVVSALVARALVLFGVLPLLAWTKLSPPVSRPYKLVIMWGGLRGAVTLALALAVTENPILPPDVHRFVAVLATGFVLFTLLVQGTTMRPVIRALGLDKLSPVDAALRGQVIAVALQNVREAVERTAEIYRLTPSIVHSEARLYAGRVDRAMQGAAGVDNILDRDKITLGLVTLAGRERDLILEHFRERTISVDLVDKLLTHASRLIDRTRIGGRSEYGRVARAALDFPWRFRLAQLAHRHLRRPDYLEALIADRFEALLAMRIILEELHSFIDLKISPILGVRVGELLHEILARRREATDRALEALRLQYPGYADELERRFIRKVALRREELEYAVLFSDGLIGPELFDNLRREAETARREADARPRLDLALNTRELISQFPLFANFSEAQLRALIDLLVPAFAVPGELLIRKGERGDAVYFIASGAVEVRAPGQKIRLGRGDFFGELALLTGRPRQSDVLAIGYCSLLRLDEADFRSFLDENPQLRAHIHAVAQDRMSSNVAALDRAHQLERG